MGAQPVHAPAWHDDFRETEGEPEVDLGLACNLSARWAPGVELRGQRHALG